jgi:putative inorganic carbon (hco3(-)) transporter
MIQALKRYLPLTVRDYLAPLGFALLLCYAIWKQNYSILNLLIFLPAILGVGYVLIFQKKWIPIIMLFCAPLSLSKHIGLGMDIGFPSELIEATVAILVVGTFLFYPGEYRKILRHPIVILALIEVAWMFICSFNSNMHIVSFKRSSLRLAYILVFLIMLAHWFRDEKNGFRFFMVYCLGFLIPIINTTIQHAQLGFLPSTAYWMSRPFYNDHTLYGACLAFLIPALLIFSFNKKEIKLKIVTYSMVILLLIIILSAEVLSFSRAAWLSLVVTAFFALLVHFKIKIRAIVFFVVTVVTVVAFTQDELTEMVRNNDAVSTKGSLSDHVMSVTNVQTDASNVERINRWKSAGRMAMQEPLFGFGPGMYQFEYGQFQLRTDMTRISTFTGNRGHAHSEFFGALAETGFLGMLLVITLMFTIIGYGLKIVYRTIDPFRRKMGYAALLGISSFYVHGFFNGFLDNDKMAILVLGSAALIVSIDLFNKEQIEKTNRVIE